MYVEDIEDGVCGFYATLHSVTLLLMLKVSKVSNTPLKGGRLFVI